MYMFSTAVQTCTTCTSNRYTFFVHVQSITFEATEEINISNCHNSYSSVIQGMNCLKDLKILINRKETNYCYSSGFV